MHIPPPHNEITINLFSCFYFSFLRLLKGMASVHRLVGQGFYFFLFFFLLCGYLPGTTRRSSSYIIIIIFMLLSIHVFSFVNSSDIPSLLFPSISLFFFILTNCWLWDPLTT
ncbi:hypothetical protein F4811DRAFT_3989 [Daldinia bambusicola]|nr:hypothetical protein F4811DRAFT_3989 [Daldinia bambusicola]